MCLTLVKVLLVINLLIKIDILAFRCDNGTEIPDSQFCNIPTDCIDGSDESYGCNGYYCGIGKFTCRESSSCFPIRVRCDGILDCLDKSDEEKCDEKTRKEVDSQNCTMNDGKFFCTNKLACIDYSNVCDGRCHCLDCSDENNQNCVMDTKSCSPCTKYCLPTTDGPVCMCESFNKETKSLCEGITKCGESSLCTHRCYKFQSREYCTCNEGYHAIPNSYGRCRSNDWYSSMIIYTTATKIKYFNLTSNETITLVKGVQCTALAAAHNHVYYTEDNGNYIFKAQISSSSTKGKKLIEWDSPITSIAVDYITNNVYFTANESLFVCINSGEHCVQLACCGVSQIVLAPTFGWIFYVKKSGKREAVYYIMKSNMDGSEETYFVDDTFETPNISLVVDESAKKILYLKYLGGILSNARLEYMSFDEESKQVKSPYTWKSVSSIGVLDHELFFSMKEAEKVNYIENFTDVKEPSVFYFSDNGSKILNLYAHNSLLPHSNDNPCAADPCDGLCLLRPTSPVNPALSYTCKSEDIPTFTQHTRTEGTFKSKECSESHNAFTTVIFLLIVLFVFAFGGYFAFRKRNSLSNWKWSKRGEETVASNGTKPELVLRNTNGTFCCSKKCFDRVSITMEVDGIACTKCESFGICKCKCVSYMKWHDRDKKYFDYLSLKASKR